MTAFEQIFELTAEQSNQLIQATLLVWSAAYGIRMIIKMLR